MLPPWRWLSEWILSCGALCPTNVFSHLPLWAPRATRRASDSCTDRHKDYLWQVAAVHTTAPQSPPSPRHRRPVPLCAALNRWHKLQLRDSEAAGSLQNRRVGSNTPQRFSTRGSVNLWQGGKGLLAVGEVSKHRSCTQPAVVTDPTQNHKASLSKATAP